MHKVDSPIRLTISKSLLLISWPPYYFQIVDLVAGRAARLLAAAGLLAVALILSALSPALSAEPATRPQVVAHRGLLRDSPENTLANFRACLELRLGFEFDVRRSKDGELVCVHDDTVDRTTDGAGPVSDLTLAELKRLDAGAWFDASFAGERIPTVDEIFSLLAEYPRAPVLLAVDLKGADEWIEADTVALAKKHKVLDRVLFIGRAIGEADVRKRLRQADAAAHVAAVANNAGEFAAALSARNADWVYVRYVPGREEVSQVHAAGKRVFIAGPTVAGHETAHWKSAADAGIDAILTDFALPLQQQLRGSMK